MSDATKDQLLGSLASGIGLGLLVGVLLGLSVANVVGSVVAGLAGIFAAFLGLTSSSAEGRVQQQSLFHSLRVGGFGLACTAGVIFGVASRANNLFGESVQTQVSHWTDAGASESDAISFVAYQQLGIVPKDRAVQAPPKPAQSAVALFSSHEQADCSQLSQTRFKDKSRRLVGMRNAGGRWAKFAEAVSKTPPETMGSTLEAGYELVCGD
jgi:hypothetical protein